MSKNQSAGNVKVGWILASALTETTFPLATTLNTSALDLTAAIAWSDYELAAGDSGDVDDRSLQDLGNAVSRGNASYGATLSMFRDKFNAASDSIYVSAFQAFRVERTLGWLVLRVNKDSRLAWAAGDEVSLFKLIADTVADSTEGEESTKFTVSFMQQGDLKVHTQIGAAGVITGVAATQSRSVASGPYQLQPVAGGASIVSRATYTSSAPTRASVSVGGTVTPLIADVAAVTITVSWGAATAAVTHALTVTV